MELAALSGIIPASLDNIGSELLRLLKITSLGAEIMDHIEPFDALCVSNHLQGYIVDGEPNFVELTDRRGVILWSLGDSVGRGERSDNPLVAAALAKGSMGYGIHRRRDQLFIVATAPIINIQHYCGTVSIGQKIDPKQLARLENGPSVQFAIWDNPEKNAVVASGQEPLPAVGFLLGDRELKRLQSGQAINKRIKLRGQEYQLVFFTMNELKPGQQNYCAVYRSMAFLSRAKRLMILQSLVMTLFVFLVVAWIGWWISQRVVDPIARLTKAARRLATLDFSERVPISTNDEIGDLAHSISFLSTALQDNMAKKDQYASELAGMNVNLERQVAQRTEDLVHAKERLEHEMAEKEDFLRAISHDLGAPLRNIAGLARLLERRHRQTLGDSGLEMIGRISNNVKNELSLIEMLLELSRIKTRRGKSTLVNLPEMLRQIQADLSYSIEEKRAQIRVQDGLPMIWAEGNRIRQVFQNLIDNAIKYIGDQPQPRLTVGWSDHPGAWMFWVGDNGIGIPEDQTKKIFGVFRRVRSRETGSVEGKGVGLASVKTIVEMYGGEIWVETELGQGSTFYFTLSRAQVNPENHREMAAEEDLEDSTTATV
jgi:signal transduction histidine kinase